MKTIVQKILFWLARLILQHHQPDIIAVTGSVGKTSTKQAIATVLASKFSVRASAENYNNEFGLPLTIIGAISGGRNPLRWLGIILKGMAYGLLPLPYPNILVLEMGIDHPGDMKYLTTLAPPHVAVVTAIGSEPVHVQFFRDVDHLAQEKFTIYKRLKKHDWAIVNNDEPYTARYTPTIKAQLMTIGIQQSADLRAEEVRYTYHANQTGVNFKLRYQGSVVPVFIPGVVGIPPVYAALIAATVGTIYGMNLVAITAALQQYQAPNGRMRLIAGQDHSIIIDDSYNASPLAVQQALRVLQTLPLSGQRLACLGDMRELGRYAKRAHTAIGKLVAELNIDFLVTVGEEAKAIAQGAQAYGLPSDRIQAVTHSTEAITVLQHHLKPGDIILVKGSQGVRLEKVVKALMAEPARASELLVRQHGHWTTL
ncbi:MAG: UDP-N-acetylmuramoyl-tripeptide--D-alanyl-D-alanine ligase [Candidatus Kerfeldbacteria bacterium]|nr:UDP-N-acetylmuramoyl-tripeptide--D-alanyl-D-alanine ligase [Candidatus Kerfeldbacteria bacterium]